MQVIYLQKSRDPSVELSCWVSSGGRKRKEEERETRERRERDERETRERRERDERRERRERMPQFGEERLETR